MTLETALRNRKVGIRHGEIKPDAASTLIRHSGARETRTRNPALVAAGSGFRIPLRGSGMTDEGCDGKNKRPVC